MNQSPNSIQPRVLVRWSNYRGESVSNPSMITSSKDITRLESFGDELRLSVNCTYKLSHIPSKILLKNTFASDTKFCAKCIKTGFCGSSLPTTIVDSHIIICHGSNQIAVKIYRGSVSFLVNRYLSVTRFPIDVRLNCGTHLRFDLTHVWWVSEVNGVVVPHASNIHGLACRGGNGGQFSRWHSRRVKRKRNNCYKEPPLICMLQILSQSRHLCLLHSAQRGQVRGE